jgi:beta-glucosidase/6-phospho-beta-glucosidase/beta-galactosidase
MLAPSHVPDRPLTPRIPSPTSCPPSPTARYAMRFGLFSYDPDSLARTARPSAALHGRVAGTGP